MTAGRSARAGFTLIEIVITGSLFVLVLGGTALAVERGMGLFRQSTANQDADSRLDRAISRVKAELMEASLASLSPILASVPGGPVTWSESLEFRCVSGWGGGAPTLDPVQRIELRLAPGELNNNADDDGDGLVDEQSIVLIRDFMLATEQEVVLVNDVLEFLEGETPNLGDDNGNGLRDEAGLAFDRDGGTLNIRISVGRAGPNGVVIRTRVASIALRN